jgi:hypothetical protein
MKRLARKGMALFTVTAAAVGAALLPATGAQADAPLACARVVAVCAWTQPHGKGTAELYFGNAPLVVAPFRSVQNQTSGRWCVYSQSFYTGKSRQVAAGQTIRRLNFAANSLRAGRC